ncbi:MAG: DNA-processing protein DprA [Rhodothermales bacterium]
MNLSRGEYEARVRLMMAEGVGPVRLRALVPPGITAQEFLDGGPHLWSRTGPLSPWMRQALEDVRGRPVTVRPPDGWSLWWMNDPWYPTLLGQIAGPPIIWVTGRTELLARPCIAVVGTRRCTDYGRRMAYKLGEALAEAGACVVSGLAYGIDAKAHRGALNAGGATAAVLGCGPGQSYPAGNRDLQARIAGDGVLISEFMPGSEPVRGHFPRRNRIISGLSAATVVVEAYDRGGALITADLAMEQNRDVYAVPGSAEHLASRGSNRLLADGAGLVVSEQDLVERLRASGYLPPPASLSESSQPVEGHNPGRLRAPQAARGARPAAEQAILAALEHGEQSVDELAMNARILLNNLWLPLARLENEGAICQGTSGRFALSVEKPQNGRKPTAPTRRSAC